MALLDELPSDPDSDEQSATEDNDIDTGNMAEQPPCSDNVLDHSTQSTIEITDQSSRGHASESDGDTVEPCEPHVEKQNAKPVPRSNDTAKRNEPPRKRQGKPTSRSHRNLSSTPTSGVAAVTSIPDGELLDCQTDDASDNEADSPTDEVRRRWTKKARKTTIPIFSLNTGVVCNKFVHCDLESPTDVFCSVFDSSITEHVVYQTNLYAVQNDKRFQPITEQNLCTFLGLTLFFGYHRLPQLRDYWSTDTDYQEAMQRDRYVSILANLHVNDNMLMPKDNKDKLYKLRPLIMLLNEFPKSASTRTRAINR